MQAEAEQLADDAEEEDGKDEEAWGEGQAVHMHGRDATDWLGAYREHQGVRSSLGDKGGFWQLSATKYDVVHH